MNIPGKLLIILFLPLTAFGQQNADSNNQVDTSELYSIIHLVIKKEKLNKDFGLQLTPASSCTMEHDDSLYLRTLLIKPITKDTGNIGSSDIFGSLVGMCYPDKNIFTGEDLEYIFRQRQLNRFFRWDNERLDFNQKNKTLSYRFSVPYLTLKKDKAIVMYEYVCPGLCGHGQTILLSKRAGGWDISHLESWIY